MKTITIQVPDWIDEKIIKELEKIVNEKIYDLLIEAAWEYALEKSKVSEKDIEILSETIKEKAWKKLKEELKL